MPFNHLCHHLLLLPSIFQSIRDFFNESIIPNRWPKYCSFSSSISPFSEYSGLIPFWIDWFDHLASQGVFSSTTIWKHQFFDTQPSLWLNSHTLYMTTAKTMALIIYTFVGKVMSLLFNTQSRFVIAFPPRSNCLLISWPQSKSAVILEPKKIKPVTLFPQQFTMKWWDQVPWS